MNRPPFPFVLGCGRSGTTLLTVMLDSHSQLSIPGETGGFILRLLDGFGAQEAPLDRRAIGKMIGQLESSHRFRAWGLDGEELMGAIEAAASRGPEDVIRTAFALYARGRGKQRYGDKTPNHVLHIERLARHFPEGVFVHVIRDGRDVALALLDVSFGPTTLRGCASYWAQRVRSGRLAGTRLGPERYIEVRYEQLVGDPEGALFPVLRLIGLAFQDTMLDYGPSVERQLSMSPVPHEDRNLNRPPTAGLRDWRRDMSARDATTFEMIAGDLLDELAYERFTGPLPAGEKVLAGLDASREVGRRALQGITGRRPTW